MREEDNPAVVNELVELDGSVAGLGRKIRSNGAQTKPREGQISILMS
jgi:hypothetical protein